MPVNLNFTIGKEALEAAIAQAGIRTILTSRVFLAKASLPELPGMVFLEDLREEITGGAKIAALLSRATAAGVMAAPPARRAPDV